MDFIKRRIETERLFEVALNMRDDDGNRVPTVSFIMPEDQFDRLAGDWHRAVAAGGRRAGHFRILRNGAEAQIGIVVSNILGYAAVPHVPVDQSEGEP